MKGIGTGKNRTMMLAVSLALIMAVCGLFAVAVMTDSKDSSAETIAITDQTSEANAFALSTEGDIIEVNTSYTLKASRTLNAGVTLVIAANKTLTVPADITLTNNGTINNGGTIDNKGTIDSKAGVLAGTGSTISALDSVVKVKSMDKTNMIGSFKFETGSKFCILEVCMIGSDNSCSLKLENNATVSISASDAGVNYVIGEGGGAKATIIGDFGATAGKFTFKNTDVVTIYSNTTLIVNSGKELVVDTGATLTNNGTINNGTIESNNGTITNKGTLINKGSINLNYTSPLDNTGTIVNGGSIGGDANIAHNGTFYAMVKILMNGGKAGVLDTIYGKIKRGTSDPMELLNPDWQTPAGNIAREGYTFNGFNKSPMPLSSGAKQICGENRIPIANATPYVEETQAKWKLISVIGQDIYADWYIKTPEAPIVSITNSSSKSVTVEELPDMAGFTRQYSDGTTWQDNNVFDNLTPGKVGGYTFKTRYNGSDFTDARGSLEATAVSVFNFYELTYYINGGNVLPLDVKTQYVEGGKKLTIHSFTDCNRNGCTPVGWNDNTDLSQGAAITDETVFSSNKAAYVKWQLNKPAKASIASVADGEININTQASTVANAVTKYYGNSTENTDGKFSSLTNGTPYGFTVKFTKGILTNVTDSEASDVFNGAVYKITYSANGGDGGPIAAQYWGTGMNAITPQEYSGIRPGFALQDNWFTETNGTGTEYAKNSSSISNLTTNLDLNATWKADAPTDFKATGAGDKSITLAATAPTGAKVNYRLFGEGWSENDAITLLSNGTEYTFEAKSVAGEASNFIESEPMTLQKTVWTLKYDNNRGIGEIGNLYLPNGSSVQADSGASFTRTGYTRDKWYPNADGNGTPVNLNQASYTPPSDNITLYMKWTPITYTIEFAAGANGTGSKTQIPATYGNSYEITATDFTGSAGYAFAGWKLTGDATYGENKYGDTESTINKSITGAEALIKNSAGAADMIFVKDLCATSGNTVTLTAQFEYLNYNILFKLYDGSTVNNPEPINDVPYGTLKEIATPVRGGYTFMGWKMSGGNTESAKWNTSNSETDASAITAYSFANAVYANPVYVYNLTQTNGADVTLTGQWKQFYVYYPEGVSNVKVGGENATSGVTTVVPGQSITWTVDTGYTVQSLNVTSGNVDKVGDVVFTAQKGSAAIVVPPAGNGSATLPADAPNGTYLFDVGTNMSVEMVLGNAGSIGVSPEIVVTLAPVQNKEGQFEFTMTVGGNPAGETATMKVTLPCDPSKGLPQVFWLDGGKKVPMKVVSVGKNSVTFETTHNSIYEIGYFVPPQIVKGSVKVTLNSNGGSMDGFMLGVKYNSTYGALPTPTKSGFEFVGWYYNGNPVSPDTPVQSNADHTLEAVWAEIEVEPEPQGSMLNSAAVAIAAAAAGMVLLFSFYVVIRARKS